MNLNGVGQGIINYQQDQRQQETHDAQLKLMAYNLEQARAASTRQQQVNANAGMALGGMNQLPPPLPQPPMPGQSSAPPQQPPMGQPQQPPMGQPQQPPMSPQAQQMLQQGTGAPAPMQRPPIPPYQTVPSGSGASQQPPAGPMAPPALAPAPKNDLGYHPVSLQSLVESLKASGVPQEQWMDTLNAMKPAMDYQNQQQLDQMKLEREARAAAQLTYQNKLAERRIDQQDTRLDEQSRHDRALEDRQTRALDQKGQPKAKTSVIRDDKGMRFTQTVNPDGSITMKDAKGREVDPESVHPMGAASQETMRNAVKLDITELDYALDKIKGLNVNTASPWFADKGDKGAMRRFFNNDMTPTEMQRYDVFANRIAPAIASLQTMGRGQISDAKVAAAAKLIPQPGDDDATVTDKLTAIKALRDRANAVQQGKSPDSIKEGLEASEPSAVGPYSDADKEARYQAWKAKNAGQ